MVPHGCTPPNSRHHTRVMSVNRLSIIAIGTCVFQRVRVKETCHSRASTQSTERNPACNGLNRPTYQSPVCSAKAGRLPQSACSNEPSYQPIDTRCHCPIRTAGETVMTWIRLGGRLKRTLLKGMAAESGRDYIYSG